MVAPNNLVNRPTVVIACAGVDAPKTHPLARLVVRRGGRVDVLAGVEMDVSAVRDRCEQQATERAWWLIAESEELDEFQVALIRELLRQSDVGSERVMTISLDDEGCVGFVDAWLQDQRDWCPAAPIGSRVRAKTMLAIPPMQTPASSAKPPQPKVPEAPRAQQTKIGPLPPAPQPKVVARPLTPPPLAVPTRTELAMEIPSPGRQRRKTVPVTPPPSRLAATAVHAQSTQPEPTPTPTVLIDLPPIEDLPPIIDLPPFELPPADASSGFEAATADVRAPTPTPVAVVPVVSEPIVITQAPVVRSARTTPTGSWVAPGQTPILDDMPRRNRRATATVLAATAAIAAAVLLWVRSGNDATPSDTTVQDEVAQVAAPQKVRVDTPTAGLPAPEPTPATVAAPLRTTQRPSLPSDPLMSALEGRDVRALDDLLVAIATDEMIERPSAGKTCKGLQIAGTSAWRLPTAKELRQLANARFVDDGHRYWVLGGKKKPAKRAKVSLRSGTRARKAGRTAKAETVCVTTAIDAQAR